MGLLLQQCLCLRWHLLMLLRQLILLIPVADVHFYLATFSYQNIQMDTNPTPCSITLALMGSKNLERNLRAKSHIQGRFNRHLDVKSFLFTILVSQCLLSPVSFPFLPFECSRFCRTPN